LVYPFEGRQVHEAMSAIIAYRISQLTPITFSISMSDYGFELLSDQPIPVDDSNARELFTTDNLLIDIQSSMNSTEMARRKFRDIAVIGGLIFQGCRANRKKPGTCNRPLPCFLKCLKNTIRKIFCCGRLTMKCWYNKWMNNVCVMHWSGSRTAISL
jgi:Lhr-like helicase